MKRASAKIAAPAAALAASGLAILAAAALLPLAHAFGLLSPGASAASVLMEAALGGAGGLVATLIVWPVALAVARARFRRERNQAPALRNHRWAEAAEAAEARLVEIEATHVGLEKLLAEAERMRSDVDDLWPGAGMDVADPDPPLGLKTLLVEGDPLDLERVIGILEALDCEVGVVPNAAAAIEALAAETYDAILLGRSPPDLDRADAVRQIRAAEAPGRRTPIVGAFEHGAVEDRQACLAAGMDGFVAKPITLAAARRALGRYVRGRPQDRGGIFPKNDNDRDIPGVVDLNTARSNVIDPRALDEMRALARDGEDRVGRVIRLFLETSPRLAERFRAAVDAGDVEAAGRHAHALQSASRNVGSLELPGMLADVEALARAGNIGGIKAAARETQRAFDDLTLALKTLQARG